MWRVLAACYLMLVLAQTQARAGDLTEKEKAAARRLFEAKCTKCHRMYEPSDYADDEWRFWMAKMSKKAKLSPNKDKLLNRYLDAYRTDKSSSKDAGTPPSAGGQADQAAADGKGPSESDKRETLQ